MLEMEPTKVDDNTGNDHACKDEVGIGDVSAFNDSHCAVGESQSVPDIEYDFSHSPQPLSLIDQSVETGLSGVDEFVDHCVALLQ